MARKIGSSSRAKGMKHNSDPLWIEHAHLNKGAFGAKAKKAKMGVQAYASKKASVPGKTGKQARLAKTFAKMSK